MTHWLRKAGSLLAAASLLASCSEEELADRLEFGAEMSPEEIGNAASRGFSLFQCAALAQRSEAEAYTKLAEQLFLEGHTELVKFIEAAQKLEPGSEAQKRAKAKVPLIVSFNLGGPSADFMAGRIWGAAEQYVDDELNDRSTWTHQKTDPEAREMLEELVVARAEQQFREQNCELLIE